MTAFLILGVAGVVLLAISLLFGEITDGSLGAFDSDWFSGAVGSAFVSAFGFGGALALGLGTSTGVAVGVGLAAGGLFGWFAAWLTRMLRRGDTDAAPRAEDVVGYDATVISSIPADGFGVVTVRIGGHLLRYHARAEVPLEAGTAAHVTGVLSPTAVTVAPLWNQDLELP